MEIHFTLNDIRQAARQFLQETAGHNVIALYGKMGAGKTTFVKAICDELGVAENVTSPTFAIVNEYTNGQTQQPIYHFDFYRIKHLEEALDIGYEDYIYSGNLCLMEWPELIEPLLPEDALRINIEETPDGHRRITTIAAEYANNNNIKKQIRTNTH